MESINILEQEDTVKRILRYAVSQSPGFAAIAFLVSLDN